MESPYALGGEVLSLVFIVPRTTGDEVGYNIYMSMDGVAEYTRIATSTLFNVYGTLESAYPITPTVDELVGFTVNFDSVQNTDIMQSISRVDLWGTRNLSGIEDEILTWETITPVTAEQFEFIGVYRGRWGTQIVAHEAEADFYYAGNGLVSIQSNAFTYGSTRFFKIVPFGANTAGSISAADVYQHTFVGEAFKPYEPINLAANGESVYPVYDMENIVLTWDGRIRGDGTGVGDPSVVTDDPATWEGLFRVRVYVDDILMRTTSSIDAQTWTYTTSMIVSDNGHYPSYITFAVSNYVIGQGSVEYESDTTNLTVRKLVVTTTTV